MCFEHYTVHCTVDEKGEIQKQGCVWVRQERIVDTIADLQPDLVFLAHSRSYLGGLDGAAAGDLDAQAAVWGDAVERFAFGVRDAGGDLVVMLDTPRFPEHPLECLIADGFDGGCGLSRARADAEAARAHGAERAALERAAHGTAIDPTSWLCGPQRCPVTDDGTVMWVDRHHLTATFAASLAPEIVDVLREAGLGA
ncbi:MAG: SGNH hydrolase domain-containing protein [Actinomycetota bacterium]